MQLIVYYPFITTSIYKYAKEPKDIVESNGVRKEKEKSPVTNMFRILFDPSSGCEIQMSPPVFSHT